MTNRWELSQTTRKTDVYDKISIINSQNYRKQLEKQGFTIKY